MIGEESTLSYHSRCIAHLRSVSDEPDAIMDENLLAAVVALRFFEELDSPFIDLPNDIAVRGLQVFLEAQASSAISSPGLRQAVFWTGFRQEFHMAFSQQRPFRLPLDTCQRYRPEENSPDYVWVNYLLVICAQIVQYCFNDQYQRSYTGYEDLVERRNRWLRSCPSSFSPVYFEQPDHNRGELFPKMWYLDDCHIVAIQSIGLTNILLAAYSPHTARIGLAHRLAMSHIDSTIRSTVREICGIALSNRQSPTALLTASIAITSCGERFTDHLEQQALMQILADMSRDYNYWPTTAMQERLREAWGWKDVVENAHQYEGQ
ncbi:uncharacterized protein LDX57_001432 [Aspergillus melleus]|uniref:uncharacterized protein n=1 Tax=Aspergillus melleus TaxID=138277 RepID=UPI001E8E436A|nr:uncharacterized protein LDX57_001432 [Aspergillus melleus]KAH8423675.1 hypothetical protein LDX57_001432 [Aspergillus melleus]